MNQIQDLESKNLKKDVPKFGIGDTVDVHYRIMEENKSRIQVFTGVVIAKKGSGVKSVFTVRRISYGEGVERVFPLHSPLIEGVEVKKKGKVRHAKLYFLRQREGKNATKVKERIDVEKSAE